MMLPPTLLSAYVELHSELAGEIELASLLAFDPHAYPREDFRADVEAWRLRLAKLKVLRSLIDTRLAFLKRNEAGSAP
jgi:hypothetical protein